MKTTKSSWIIGNTPEGTFLRIWFFGGCLVLMIKQFILGDEVQSITVLWWAFISHFSFAFVERQRLRDLIRELKRKP